MLMYNYICLQALQNQLNLAKEHLNKRRCVTVEKPKRRSSPMIHCVRSYTSVVLHVLQKLFSLDMLCLRLQQLGCLIYSCVL